jgi:5'-nucleotidase
VTGDTRIGPWVLVTNDDGVDSPALPPLLEALRGLVSVRAVLPAREYSWSSKGMSRFARLRLAPAEALGPEVWTVDGSPADCANIGIHHLAPEPPALVVSGVNIGENTGLAFLLSSGTVAGALEGTLAGVPGAAFSLKLSAELYNGWRDTRDPAPLQACFSRAAAITGEIVAELLEGGLPGDSRLISVNIPEAATTATPRRLCGVANTTYGSFYRRDEQGDLVHHYDGYRRLADDGEAAEERESDADVLAAGAVAIAPLRLDLSVAPTAADRLRFDRGGA